MKDILYEHLKPENREITFRLTKYGAWIKFWSEECVQLDGDFSLKELKVLVEVMESFKEKKDF
jgi:hypothetical protein